MGTEKKKTERNKKKEKKGGSGRKAKANKGRQTCPVPLAV
jgi:hypothetical protein